jgi:hypothetical protein
MGQKGSNTAYTTTAPNAGVMAAYQGVLQGAQKVVDDNPYKPYGGDLVAPVNQQQGLGIGNINQSAGFAQPFINEAAGYARNAADPISGADISQYESPYLNDVVNATSAQFAHDNAVQQQGVIGNAAAQGALGGDRVGVAQAQLAGAQQRAQAPVLAGLRNQGYQTALQTAMQQQANQGNAAYSLGNLGVAGQNAGLTGANAQIGAGTLQQNTLQNLYNAQYGQYATAQAFPYQQTQWLAGIDTGVGSQMGGHSETTAPPPNPFASLLGLGVAGLGAAGKFAAYGGRIQGFAPGGGVDGNMPFAGHGWIPPNQITMGRGAPPPPSAPSMGNPGLDIGRMAASFGRGSSPAVVSRPLNINPSPFMPTQGGDVMSSAPSAAAGFGNGPIYYRGGKVQGFADSGAVRAPDDSLNPRNWIGWQADDGTGGTFAPMDPNRAPSIQKGPNEMAPVDDAEMPANPKVGGFGGPNRNNITNLPPIITDGDGNGRLPPQTLRYAPEDDSGGAEPQSGFGASAAPAGDRSSLSHALMAAGLGMMASKSPFLSNAIGEGGLSGLNAYTQAQQRKVENTNKATTQRLSQQRLDQEARRLDQAAKQAQRHLDLQERQFGESTKQHGVTNSLTDRRLQNEQERHADELKLRREQFDETQKQHERQLNAGKIPPGFRTKEDGTLEAIPGGPHDPEVMGAVERAKHNASPLSQEAKEIGSWQIVRGNIASAMKGLGKGMQSDARMMELRNGAAEILTNKFGYSPEQAAGYINEQEQAYRAAGTGKSAEARTVGTREGNLGIILRATDAAIPAAIDASENVARTGWVPINQLIQKGEVIASDPRLKEFGMANLQLAEHWARAMNPTGVMRESDRDLALKFLNTADSKETYRAAVMQLGKQIHREMDAVKGGKPSPMGDHPDPVKSGSSDAGAPKVVGDRQQFKQGWGVWDGTKWVPEGKQ